MVTGAQATTIASLVHQPPSFSNGHVLILKEDVFRFFLGGGGRFANYKMG